MPSGKSAGLDYVATLAALRAGNIGLAEAIAGRHRDDAGAYLQHGHSITLSLLESIDKLADELERVTGKPVTHSEDLLARVRRMILDNCWD